MRTANTILLIVNIMVIFFLSSLILSLPASADELPNNNGPAFGVQVFHCDADGNNCVSASPVIKKVTKPAPSRGQTADEIISKVIERVEAERALQRLLAEASVNRDRRPLDSPKPTELAGR